MEFSPNCCADIELVMEAIPVFWLAEFSTGHLCSSVKSMTFPEKVFVVPLILNVTSRYSRKV